MLNFFSRPWNNCEGIHRREFLKVGTLTGLGLSLPALFAGKQALARSGKKTKDVLFIDASRDYQDEKKQNRLRPTDINRVVNAFMAFKSEHHYAHRATIEEIQENDFNLNIPRYVDTFEEEEQIDIRQTQAEIAGIDAQLSQVQQEMERHLKELGYGS